MFWREYKNKIYTSFENIRSIDYLIRKIGKPIGKHIIIIKIYTKWIGNLIYPPRI